MKTLKCDLCEVTAQGNTFEEWMMALMPHYMEVHKDVMTENMNKPEEEQRNSKEKWMKDNMERFNAVL